MQGVEGFHDRRSQRFLVRHVNEETLSSRFTGRGLPTACENDRSFVSHRS